MINGIVDQTVWKYRVPDISSIFQICFHISGAAADNISSKWIMCINKICLEPERYCIFVSFCIFVKFYISLVDHQYRSSFAIPVPNISRLCTQDTQVCLAHRLFTNIINHPHRLAKQVSEIIEGRLTLSHDSSAINPAPIGIPPDGPYSQVKFSQIAIHHMLLDIVQNLIVSYFCRQRYSGQRK